MDAQTDSELLKTYAESRSETAFAELVRRHVDLVYSAAMRMAGESHAAKDVTQAVFVALAQNAPELANHPVLSGWLHCTARNLAAKNIRGEIRRHSREQEAAAMNEMLSAATEPTWEEIAPHLDAALGELSPAERDAVMLRYFEKKSAPEMAGILGVSTDAAQKRVNRAVERLREHFAKRGVTVGASGLVLVVTANAVQAAPAGLALTITGAVVLTGTAVATSTAITATKTIAMTGLQKTLIVTTAIALGTAAYETYEASSLRKQVNALQRQGQPAQMAAPPLGSNDSALAALQQEVNQLAAQKAKLAGSLEQANAEKKNLEEAKQQAERSAKLFRELAAQANANDPNLTNEYPDVRHVYAGMGKIMALTARLDAIKDRKDSEKTEEEKATEVALMTKFLGDTHKLLKAADKFGVGPNSSDEKLNSPDAGACMLFGALELDEQQFQSVYSILQSTFQRAAEQNLLRKDANSDAKAAAKDLDAQAKAGIEKLLSSEQRKTFQSILPEIDLVEAKELVSE